MWNRIDRYISTLFIGYFFAGLIVFVSLSLVIDAMSTMVTYKGVGIETFAKYYFYFLPEFLYKMIPVASVLSSVFTLSVLNRNNELIALYSLGMGLFRISIPIIFWASVLGMGMFFMSDQLMPRFAKQKNYIFYNDLKKNPSLYSIVKTNKIWYRSKDNIFYIKTLNDKTLKAQGLTLYYFDEAWNLIQMITAKDVDLLGTHWLLHNGSVTLFTESSSFPLTSDFKTKSIVMGEDAKDISSTVHPSNVLSLDDLSQYIKKNKEAGLDTIRYEVDYHSKYSFSLAGLVMVLLSIPLSVSRTRSGGAMLNMGFTLGLVFVYWIFLSSFITLGNHGYIPPLLAGWGPNIIMASLAFIFIRKKKN